MDLRNGDIINIYSSPKKKRIYFIFQKFQKQKIFTGQKLENWKINKSALILFIF